MIAIPAPTSPRALPVRHRRLALRNRSAVVTVGHLLQWRIAALEKRLDVRLLQRTTRTLAVTEAGQRFYDRCLATVEGAQAAYASVAELRREPAGLVRLCSQVLLTQKCLAHALPGYMAAHPKVSVFVEPTDRTINVIEE
jgi:DNA-binding transcriptional LysR family regulator